MRLTILSSKLIEIKSASNMFKTPWSHKTLWRSHVQADDPSDTIEDTKFSGDRSSNEGKMVDTLQDSRVVAAPSLLNGLGCEKTTTRMPTRNHGCGNDTLSDVPSRCSAGYHASIMLHHRDVGDTRPGVTVCGWHCSLHCFPSASHAA